MATSVSAAADVAAPAWCDGKRPRMGEGRDRRCSVGQTGQTVSADAGRRGDGGGIGAAGA